jgi:hypothetical protein
MRALDHGNPSPSPASDEVTVAFTESPERVYRPSEARAQRAFHYLDPLPRRQQGRASRRVGVPGVAYARVALGVHIAAVARRQAADGAGSIVYCPALDLPRPSKGRRSA